MRRICASLRQNLAWHGTPVLPDKASKCRTIAKRLRAAFSCGGIGPNYVCIGQTVLKFRSCQKLVNEPGSETISGAHIIHSLHSRGHEAVLLLPGPANGCGSPAFHDYNLRQSCQHVDGLGKVLGAGSLLRLSII